MSNVMSLFFLLLYANITFCIQQDTQSHPISCIGLDNGLHYIRPTSFIELNVNNNQNIDIDSLPSILVKCFNNWIIFDYSLDPNIKHYFSTFMSITDDFASMDIGQEHINWPDWFLIKNIKYSTSEDCNTCITNNNNDIAYYMTGNYYGCSFATKSLCDMSPTTLQCNQCSGLLNDDNLYPGLCTHITLNINDKNINTAETAHQKCVTAKWNYLPSIGLNGRFCACIKPNDNQLLKVKAKYIQSYSTEKRSTSKTVDCKENIIELTNDDFKHGTYRIQSCGIYKLMEDILLNMNAPTTDYNGSPNDNNYWWPTYKQQQNEYPNNNFIGAYAMGFFAGISIENNDVIIDLNGFEIAMHFDFYIQQRFFSLIELASKPFVSGQGPVNFGNDNVIYPSNIIITNGNLGLTSHHCIHGNNNENVRITNIKMYDFEVCGIAMNGFKDLWIENVDIGPNYQNIPITSSYAHGRFMLQRLELIENYNDDKFVWINNKKVFLDNILETLRNEMDDAFHFAHNIDKIDVNDDIYNNIFVNSDGLAHGGTLYGIFLNSEGASVFGLGLSPGHSDGLILNNINIHELRSAPLENVRAQLTRGPFNDLLDMKKIIKYDKNDEYMKYKGTSYSNAQYALITLINDNEWSILGHSFINKQILKWIEGKNDNNKMRKLKVKFKCNSDIMLHLTKGIFGVRIDNVQNIEINGYLNINGLHNLGELGEDELCGNYYNAKTGGHHNQVYPEQIGYTGNEVHGITFIGSNGIINQNSEIKINDLLSAKGSIFGINFYKKNDIKIDKYCDLMVTNLYSGAQLNDNDYNRLNRNIFPNVMPRTCVIDVWLDANNKVNIHKLANVNSKCVNNYDECSFKYSLIDDNKYNEENEILNKDFIRGEIDNDNCRHIINQNSLRSDMSEFHLDTIKLLELHDRNNTANNNDNKILILVGVFGVIIIFILVYLFSFGNKNKRKLQQMNDHECVPLI